MIMEISIDKIAAAQVRQFSEKDKAYMLQEERLKPFWKYPMDINAFDAIIENRKQHKVDRNLLLDVLSQQYNQLGYTFDNPIDLLDENTFTITTAHQPSLMTGPLYFIYKAVSAIKLTRSLKEKYPSYNFAPVFVIGGEDHDFEEINHFKLFGKTLTWDNQNQVGACGRMKLNGIEDVLSQLDEILGDSDQARKLYSILVHAFSDSTLSYGQATQRLTLELFKDTELLVLSMDNKAFKKAFSTIIRREILENFSKPLVEKTIDALAGVGLKMQAYPRSINLFYLSEEGRNRIERKEDKYIVVNTDLIFTEAELLQELEENPESFSPNVVLRPLYQEYILPNLAYVGGGGEIAYWLERKSQFEAAGIPFPMLVRRDSVLYIDANTKNKWSKLGLQVEDWFKDTETLKKEFVQANSKNEISLESELETFNSIIESIAEKTELIDKSLVGRIEAEGSKMRKSLEGMEKRIQKTEKQKFSQSISQIEKLKERLFPNDGLQERTDNFMGLYLKHGDDLIPMLLDAQNPMDVGLKIISA